jgi:hypothetical protein
MPIAISDNSTLWNTDSSLFPDIVTDGDTIHVVWVDSTNDPRWGYDDEIFYINYIPGKGWSEVYLISDGPINWNNDTSKLPSIDVKNAGNIYIVWYDNTNGWWGSDWEIMYMNFQVVYTTTTITTEIPGFEIAMCLSAIFMIGSIVIITEKSKKNKLDSIF